MGSSFLVALLLPLLAAAGTGPKRATGPCDPPAAGAPQPSRDLYCIELFPTDAAGGGRGTAALDWTGGPFTVSVAADGTQRFGISFDLHDLPPLTGRRAGYVAWAASPMMSPMIRLGVVREGRTAVKSVTLDQFVLMITAEPDTGLARRRGPIVLRGQSASSRLRPPELFQLALGATASPAHMHHGSDSADWNGVPMLPGFGMLPAEMALRPSTPGWLPPVDSTAPLAGKSQVVRLQDGDTLELTAMQVRRLLAGREYTAFGFNGQLPGPLLRVAQGTTIVVRFHNRLPLPSTIHWHGLRLDTPNDGVPGLSQPPVAPGEDFTYHLRFPDAGLYWYHPHVREDIQQDLGLYGNIFVPPPASASWSAAREYFLMLDDLLLASSGPVPYGRDSATHAAMGRFGNQLLVNGEPRWQASVRAGETVRLFLTNAAGARTFNLSLEPAVPFELRAADLGRYPEPVVTSHLVLAPAERYVAEVRFPRPGRYLLVNRVHGLDHLYGRFVPLSGTLGIVTVTPGDSPKPAPPAIDSTAATELAEYLSRADQAERRTLELAVRFSGLPFLSERLMRLDSIYFAPVEWAGTMPTMNWATTADQAHWLLRDPADGRENHDIDWRFPRGTLLRLTLVAQRDVLHAMQHPIHLHGQRFLILAVGGVPNPHPVWKDTVLVPAGSTVELLVDLSNPGRWMLHCHIAEHLGAGMMTTLVVEE